MSQDLHVILATDICAKAQGFENLSRGILKTWQHRVPFIFFPRTYFKETEAQTYITTFYGLSYSVWNVKCGTCTAWVMSTVLCLLCPPFYSLNHNLSGVTFFCSAVLPWTLPPVWTAAVEILLSSFLFQTHDSFSKEMFTSRSHQLDASQSVAFPLGESQAPSVIWVRFVFHHRLVGHLCSGSNSLWGVCRLASKLW